jgi:hypothetical protein
LLLPKNVLCLYRVQSETVSESTAEPISVSDGSGAGVCMGVSRASIALQARACRFSMRYGKQ